jgi:hypothetical protein
MIELRKRKDNDVGFVDPYVVYKHPNPPPRITSLNLGEIS